MHHARRVPPAQKRLVIISSAELGIREDRLVVVDHDDDDDRSSSFFLGSHRVGLGNC